MDPETVNYLHSGFISPPITVESLDGGGSASDDDADGGDDPLEADKSKLKASGSTLLAAVGSSVVSVAQTIRCATVDNFQGEEAKVIILSLTRNNSQGNIGG